MTMLAEEKASVATKTNELCEAIVADERFGELQASVKSFLDDDMARTMYQSVHERGSSLQQKQQAGVELGETEVREFEQARDELLQNEVAKSFMDAQRELEQIQKMVNERVGMTLELGRVPTEEDLQQAQDGCCGGGGCGCS